MQTPETLRELVIGGVTYETRYTKKFEQRAPYVALLDRYDSGKGTFRFG